MPCAQTNTNSFLIGAGHADADWDSAQGSGTMALVNAMKLSLGVGFNSDIPTLVVDSSKGAGTTGSVGIGTGSLYPLQKLEVDSGNILISNSRWQKNGIDSIAGQLQLQSPDSGNISSFEAADSGAWIRYILRKIHR